MISNLNGKLDLLKSNNNKNIENKNQNDFIVVYGKKNNSEKMLEILSYTKNSFEKSKKLYENLIINSI